MQGWIKLHRKIQDWQWHDNPMMVSLFVHILLLANHEEHIWHNQVVKPGQFITGRKSLSRLTGLSEQSLRTCIKRLKSTNEITIKSTSQFSVITIINWEQYQSTSEKSTNEITTKLTNNQPATNQRLTTNKNDNNNKNDKLGEKSPEVTNHSMGNIRLEDNEITYEEDAGVRPKKPKARNKLYTRIALSYLKRKNEKGDVLRYFKDIKELVKITEGVIKDAKIEVTDETIVKAIEWRFDQADKMFTEKNLEWGFGAVIKNFNKLN